MNEKQARLTIKLSFLLSLISCLFIGNVIAQSTPKGATITAATDTGKRGNTWAVIVGISKYQNVAGLNYADKDALAFYDYLVNKKGVDSAHIQLLINEKAIASDIYAALDWLNLSIKENDRVIFYFSGHGDVEKKTIHQNGFLLAYDAPIAAYMAKGTVSVNYLQDYLETYVAKKKVKDVILIVDACRAGKLAGGTEGIQITMHALGETWNNQIIKILSAQEGESSFEDKKWGGGRGVFSYYLVKGLEGLANRNADSVITTAELAAYLPFAVGDATSSVQNPTVSGNPKTNLFTFNKQLLILASQQENQQQAGQTFASRGTKEDLDPEIKQWYDKYRFFVQKGRLIAGERKTDSINCAKFYYLKLVNDARAKTLVPSLKSSFLSALKRKTEIQLDDFINGVISQYYPLELTYQEMIYARSLIDTNYILYNYINARIIFMESLNRVNPVKVIELCKKVIQIEPDASYAYFRIGDAFMDREDKDYIDSAIYYFNTAIKLCPTWVTAYRRLAKYYFHRGDKKRAFYYGEKEVELNKLGAGGYFLLAEGYRALKEDKKADSVLNKFIEVKTSDNEEKKFYELPKYYADLWLAYMKLKNYTKANDYYKKAVILDTLSSISFQIFKDFYYYQNDYDNFLKVSLDGVKEHPQDFGNYYDAACGYSLKNDTKKSLAYLKISFEKGYNDYNNISKDTDLTNIRQLPEFEELMKKYFPDSVK